MSWAGNPGGVAGSGDEEPTATTPTTTWVQHYRVPCEGYEGEHACYLVSDSAAGPWSFAYGGLHDFAFEWGHVYSVELGFTPGAGGQDAPTTNSNVTRIVSDVPVDPAATTFDALVRPAGSPALRFHDDGTSAFLDEIDFSCDPEALCDEMMSLQLSAELFFVTFEHSVDLTTLVARAVSTDVEAYGPYP